MAALPARSSSRGSLRHAGKDVWFLPALPPLAHLPDNPVALPLCRRTYAQNAPFVSAPHTHIMPHMPHSRRRSRRSRTRGSAAAAAAASRLGIGIGERQFDSRQPVRAAGNCRIIFMAFEATATWHATLALASPFSRLFLLLHFVNPKNNGRESRKVRAGSVCVARCMLHMCAECR